MFVDGRHHGVGHPLRWYAIPASFVGPRWKIRQDVKDKRSREENGRAGGWRDDGNGVVGIPARWQRQPPKKERGDWQRRSRYVDG